MAKNKLTFSSAEDSSEINKQILSIAGSNEHLQKYGITGGRMKPEELIEVRKKITAARLATAKWINDAMIAEGIDPNSKSKYNKEKIKFIKDVIKERWNKESKPGVFSGRPKEVQELNKFIKRRKTWGEGFASLNPMLWGGLGKRQQLLASSQRGSSPYLFLDETEKLLGGITKIGSTRYSSNVDSKWAKKNLGANLFKLSSKDVNPYYDKDLDTPSTAAYSKETAKAKQRYFRRNSVMADVNPLGYLFNVSEDNPSFAGKKTVIEPGSPYNPSRTSSGSAYSGTFGGGSGETVYGGGGWFSGNTDIRTSTGGSTTLTIHKGDDYRMAGRTIKAGDKLGVLTRSQRRNYNREVLGINT